MSKKLIFMIFSPAIILLACNPIDVMRRSLPEGLHERVAIQPTREPMQVFADAWDKMKSLQKYRAEFTNIDGVTIGGNYSEDISDDDSGEIDGMNAHYVAKGSTIAQKTGSKFLEIIETGSKKYIKGIGMFGLTDPNVWYVQKDNPNALRFRDTSSLDYLIRWKSTSRSIDFKKIRNESFDGQSCDVYLYNFVTTRNDEGELSVWLCADGYFHKYILTTEADVESKPPDKYKRTITVHIYDLNNATIQVQRPQDVQPMPGG